jgi:hypothetical protein
MMGAFNEVDDMFRGVQYNKFTSGQIREAMNRKVEAVRAKIEERRGRIDKITRENEITPEALSDLIVQYSQDQRRGGGAKMSYSIPNSNTSSGNRTKETVVPAGVIANLVTEKELVTSETAEVKRLDLILRNLKDDQPFVDEKTGELRSRAVIHTLDDAEIEYLGF